MAHLNKIAPETVICTDRRYVDNGKVMTSGGISAGIDLSLHVVQKLYGKDVVDKRRIYMEYGDWERLSKKQKNIEAWDTSDIKIVDINEGNIQKVAEFMSAIKPEFWDFAGALGQLKSGIGWAMLSETGEIEGWLLCKVFDCYKIVQIECLGYNDNGNYAVCEALQPLEAQCELLAKSKGYVNMRFIMGSRNTSCHGRMLGEPWQELKELKVKDRREYDWFISMGYKPSGLLPDIYGSGYHGIELIKRI